MNEIRSTNIYKEMEKVFNAQRESFLKEGFPSLKVRIDRIDRMIAQLAENKDRIIAALSSDYGVRAPFITLAFDVAGTIDSLTYAKEHLPQWMKDEEAGLSEANKANGIKSKILRQPLGVVGVVSPWNVPVNLALGAPLAYPLAAGNRVMIKPSSKTASTAALIKEMVEAAFDPTEVAVFTGTGEVNDAFDSLPFDKIILTGSPKVARQVMGQFAENLVPAILELGGKNPTIIGKECDLDYAVETIWGGKMLNSGQVCISADHVFVPAGKEDAFIEKSRALLSGWYPTVRDNPNYTAIVDKGNYQRLLGYLDEARAKGFRVERLTPDEELSGKYRQIPPHIIVNPTEELGVMRDEVFGPLMPLLSYTRMDDIIDRVNRKPRPLAAYYFGSDESNIRKVEEFTTSGGVTINDLFTHCLDENMPFGGVGNSGMGKYHGRAGYECFTTNKAVAYQNVANPMRTAFHPPYTKEKEQYLESMIPKVQLRR